jgi:hypothetical protein
MVTASGAPAAVVHDVHFRRRPVISPVTRIPALEAEVSWDALYATRAVPTHAHAHTDAPALSQHDGQTGTFSTPAPAPASASPLPITPRLFAPHAPPFRVTSWLRRPAALLLSLLLDGSVSEHNMWTFLADPAATAAVGLSDEDLHAILRADAKPTSPAAAREDALATQAVLAALRAGDAPASLPAPASAFSALLRTALSRALFWNPEERRLTLVDSTNITVAGTDPWMVAPQLISSADGTEALGREPSAQTVPSILNLVTGVLVSQLAAVCAGSLNVKPLLPALGLATLLPPGLLRVPGAAADIAHQLASDPLASQGCVNGLVLFSHIDLSHSLAAVTTHRNPRPEKVHKLADRNVAHKGPPHPSGSSSSSSASSSRSSTVPTVKDTTWAEPAPAPKDEDDGGSDSEVSHDSTSSTMRRRAAPMDDTLTSLIPDPPAALPALAPLYSASASASASCHAGDGPSAGLGTGVGMASPEGVSSCPLGSALALTYATLSQQPRRLLASRASNISSLAELGNIIHPSRNEDLERYCNLYNLPMPSEDAPMPTPSKPKTVVPRTKSYRGRGRPPRASNSPGRLAAPAPSPLPASATASSTGSEAEPARVQHPPPGVKLIAGTGDGGGSVLHAVRQGLKEELKAEAVDQARTRPIARLAPTSTSTPASAPVAASAAPASAPDADDSPATALERSLGVRVRMRPLAILTPSRLSAPVLLVDLEERMRVERVIHSHGLGPEPAQRPLLRERAEALHTDAFQRLGCDPTTHATGAVVDLHIPLFDAQFDPFPALARTLAHGPSPFKRPAVLRGHAALGDAPSPALAQIMPPAPALPVPGPPVHCVNTDSSLLETSAPPPADEAASAPMLFRGPAFAPPRYASSRILAPSPLCLLDHTPELPTLPSNADYPWAPRAPAEPGLVTVGPSLLHLPLFLRLLKQAVPPSLALAFALPTTPMRPPHVLTALRTARDNYYALDGPGAVHRDDMLDDDAPRPRLVDGVDGDSSRFPLSHLQRRALDILLSDMEPSNDHLPPALRALLALPPDTRVDDDDVIESLSDFADLTPEILAAFRSLREYKDRLPCADALPAALEAINAVPAERSTHVLLRGAPQEARDAPGRVKRLAPREAQALAYHWAREAVSAIETHQASVFTPLADAAACDDAGCTGAQAPLPPPFMPASAALADAASRGGPLQPYSAERPPALEAHGYGFWYTHGLRGAFAGLPTMLLQDEHSQPQSQAAQRASMSSTAAAAAAEAGSDALPALDDPVFASSPPWTLQGLTRAPTLQLQGLAPALKVEKHTRATSAAAEAAEDRDMRPSTHFPIPLQQHALRVLSKPDDADVDVFVRPPMPGNTNIGAGNTFIVSPPAPTFGSFKRQAVASTVDTHRELAGTAAREAEAQRNPSPSIEAEIALLQSQYNATVTRLNALKLKALQGIVLADLPRRQSNDHAMAFVTDVYNRQCRAVAARAKQQRKIELCRESLAQAHLAFQQHANAPPQVRTPALPTIYRRHQQAAALIANHMPARQVSSEFKQYALQCAAELASKDRSHIEAKPQVAVTPALPTPAPAAALTVVNLAPSPVASPTAAPAPASCACMRTLPLPTFLCRQCQLTAHVECHAAYADAHDAEAASPSLCLSCALDNAFKAGTPLDPALIAALRALLARSLGHAISVAQPAPADMLASDLPLPLEHPPLALASLLPSNEPLDVLDNIDLVYLPRGGALAVLRLDLLEAHARRTLHPLLTLFDRDEPALANYLVQSLAGILQPRLALPLLRAALVIHKHAQAAQSPAAEVLPGGAFPLVVLSASLQPLPPPASPEELVGVVPTLVLPPWLTLSPHSCNWDCSSRAVPRCHTFPRLAMPGPLPCVFPFDQDRTDIDIPASIAAVVDHLDTFGFALAHDGSLLNADGTPLDPVPLVVHRFTNSPIVLTHGQYSAVKVPGDLLVHMPVNQAEAAGKHVRWISTAQPEENRRYTSLVPDVAIVDRTFAPRARKEARLRMKLTVGCPRASLRLSLRRTNPGPRRASASHDSAAAQDSQPPTRHRAGDAYAVSFLRFSAARGVLGWVLPLCSAAAAAGVATSQQQLQLLALLCRRYPAHVRAEAELLPDPAEEHVLTCAARCPPVQPQAHALAQAKSPAMRHVPQMLRQAQVMAHEQGALVLAPAQLDLSAAVPAQAPVPAPAALQRPSPARMDDGEDSDATDVEDAFVAMSIPASQPQPQPMPMPMPLSQPQPLPEVSGEQPVAAQPTQAEGPDDSDAMTDDVAKQEAPITAEAEAEAEVAEPSPGPAVVAPPAEPCAPVEPVAAPAPAPAPAAEPAEAPPADVVVATEVAAEVMVQPVEEAAAEAQAVDIAVVSAPTSESAQAPVATPVAAPAPAPAFAFAPVLVADSVMPMLDEPVAEAAPGAATETLVAAAVEEAAPPVEEPPALAPASEQQQQQQQVSLVEAQPQSEPVSAPSPVPAPAPAPAFPTPTRSSSRLAKLAKTPVQAPAAPPVPVPAPAPVPASPPIEPAAAPAAAAVAASPHARTRSATRSAAAAASPVTPALRSRQKQSSAPASAPVFTADAASRSLTPAPMATSQRLQTRAAALVISASTPSATVAHAAAEGPAAPVPAEEEEEQRPGPVFTLSTMSISEDNVIVGKRRREPAQPASVVVLGTTKKGKSEATLTPKR